MVTDAAGGRSVTDFAFPRVHVDLAAGAVTTETVACADLEDVLGGIARGFKLLADRPVADAYDPAATLVMNLGLLSGTEVMTGLRTFFHAYSPLKGGRGGKPAAMWTAGSGKFGTKLRHAGVEEVLFTGRCAAPTIVRVHADAAFEFLPAGDLAGGTVNEKIQALHARWPDAHFAVLGPAGEAWESCRYAAIALSTENQLRSGDPKARYCGRGGIGGVLGSKNVLAIVADAADPKGRAVHETVKRVNLEIARGEGSRRFRDASKGGGGGGTWANYEALGPVHAVPEFNFAPSGTDASLALHRPRVEGAGPWLVKDEACYRCGIKCHKNVYEKGADGKAGAFRAKLDYEPLNLLSSNLGIFDVDAACTLVELVDELGMDSISCGVTLAYAMEYNRRNPGADLAGGLAYGDFEGAARVIGEIGRGALPALGQGSMRLAADLDAPEYAMHCKGVEFPAYLPQTNPGYPFALAGGHMSMKTYLLLLHERETGLDYWVEAITKRGPAILRDDLLGLCKFAGLGHDDVIDALRAVAGLETTREDLARAVRRTHLRGYRIERAQGFDEDDYAMPEDVHREHPEIDLPHFNTKEFFDELRTRVLARFDEMLAEEAL